MKHPYQCAISVQSGILTGAREALSASFREKGGGFPGERITKAV